jgi:hypothetical protein
MNENNKPFDHLLNQLHERTKELNCLYRIDEIFSQQYLTIEEVCLELIQALPFGWKYPEACVAKIVLDGKTYTSDGFVETEWVLSADIVLQDMVIGTISVYYTEQMPSAEHGPFLKEEVRLIKTIADRMSHHVHYQRMQHALQDWEFARSDSGKGAAEWHVVLNMFRNTDRNLYLGIARKMLNHLCWSGILEAERLIESSTLTESTETNNFMGESNQPHVRRPLAFSEEMSAAAFEIADKHLADDEILKLIQKWIQEDKLAFLIQVVNRNLTLSEVADAIRRYHHLAPPKEDLVPSPGKRGVAVSLIRRFLSDQLAYIEVAKRFIGVRDFYKLIQNVIFTNESHGKLGGKSAGLYLAAQILRKKSKDHELLRNVKIPRTWHITSDVLVHFMHYNNFDEVVEQKYKSINQVRLEYPHIVQSFKTARFPGDIVRGLSMALDDLGDRPLIVRSSSLLEDRIGAAFSGKYRSLFLANQGSKQKRLDALMDAIAEVYASTFSPDPIEYRAQRGLLDFGEEMGIIIQEVVGTRVGKYFLPAWAGVAFSHNEFRWSPRIKREDGLMRMVPGLGTRAVDRLGDDYPVLIAPGQPNLKVNVSPDETARYSPAYLDVINLQTDSFETVRFDRFISEVQYDFPGLKDIISVYEDNHLRRPLEMNIDFDNDHLVATFDGLINRSRFVKRMKLILDTLQKELESPVDIEFASDGQDLYLLQCRPQSNPHVAHPSPIPHDIPSDQVVFRANRYVSNGRVPDISHIVFVDPERYSQLPDRDSMIAVGRAVGRLNQILPKRQFVLMGPGRWGSRGDIKLGVSITYSDINNTCLLIEVAMKKGNYLPDLSFGTHFFQDLVEADIRYLPLYPDDDECILNLDFLRTSDSVLARVLPEFSQLEDCLRLIDVPSLSDGKVLRVLMNADLDEAVGLLALPGEATESVGQSETANEASRDDYWRWRMVMVEALAQRLDRKRFGVKKLYVIGSTKNATAGPGSDIDLLVHFGGTEQQRQQLRLWLEGWSKALAEINYIRTGYQSEGLIDAHIVTDEDIEKKTSYAAKIGAITDPARELTVGQRK